MMTSTTLKRRTIEPVPKGTYGTPTTQYSIMKLIYWIHIHITTLQSVTSHLQLYKIQVIFENKNLRFQVRKEYIYQHYSTYGDILSHHINYYGKKSETCRTLSFCHTNWIINWELAQPIITFHHTETQKWINCSTIYLQLTTHQAIIHRKWHLMTLLRLSMASLLEFAESMNVGKRTSIATKW